MELGTPRDIKAYLDEHVVGQDYAKTALSVAVYNHYRNKEDAEEGDIFGDGVKLEKANLLFMGPTGSGKTYLIQTIAKKLKVPFVFTDAMAYSETGFKGDDVSKMINILYEEANHDVDAAERGIIYIDEIDKIACKGKEHDVTYKAHSGMQHSLLKMLEGTKIEVERGSSFRNTSRKVIDTTNVLFICGGAFVGLDEIVKERLNRKVIGFGTGASRTDGLSDYELLSMASPEDLCEFGLIPEFIGRLHMLVPFEQLDVRALESILTEPANALLKQYQKRLALEGITLKFTPDAVRAIAEKACERGTGARGLRAFTEKLLLDVMFQAPSFRDRVDSIVITPDCVEGTADPLFISGEKGL